MSGRRKRAVVPWIVAAALAVVFLLGRADREGVPGHGPKLDGAPSARVERVVDGDTVRLVGLGSVRLIGINTPEVYGHVQCFGPQASAFAKSVLHPGTRVRYQVGREAHD